MNETIIQSPISTPRRNTRRIGPKSETVEFVSSDLFSGDRTESGRIRHSGELPTADYLGDVHSQFRTLVQQAIATWRHFNQPSWKGGFDLPGEHLFETVSTPNATIYSPTDTQHYTDFHIRHASRVNFGEVGFSGSLGWAVPGIMPSTPPYSLPSPYDPDLADALLDLGEIVEEALEKDYPEPTVLARENARRLLIEIYRLSPRRYEVYPRPTGEIVIDGTGKDRRWLMILCGSEGEVTCLVKTDGRRRDNHYATAATLPDDLLAQALRDLG